MTTTPTVPTWKTEFDERIKAFATAIGVEEPKVCEVLTGLGATGDDEQSLVIIESDEFLPMGDLRGAFVDSGLTQIARLRSGMPHLRGKTRIEESVKETTNGDSLAGAVMDLVKSNRPKADWSDRELLEAHDEDATEVIEALRKRSKGRYCIVYKSDRSINVDVSLGLLKTAKRQPTTDQHRVDGKPVRVYRPGEFLAKALDESPFALKVALVNDYCSVSDTDWTGVGHKQRVLVRIHIMKVETAKLSTREMGAICNDARTKSLEEFEGTLSKATLLYGELDEQDRLPNLKIMPSEVDDRSAFNVHQGQAPGTGYEFKDTGFNMRRRLQSR